MLNSIFDKKFNSEKKITSSTYFKISAEVKNNLFNLKEKKIIIISSFTIEIIENYLIVELARRGIKGNLKFLPINQFEQNIFKKDSDLYKFIPDTIILFPSLEDFCEDAIGVLKKKSIEGFIDRYKSWIEELRRNCNSQILAANLQVSSMLNELKNEENINFLIAKTNLSLLNFCKKIENCFIFDYYNSLHTFGTKSWTDLKYFYIGKIRQSYDAQIFLASSISRTLSAIYFIPKKCLVLDADNTLWGGVLGEDGIGGIELSEAYPGNVYKEFHKYLLRQRQKGIILAIVSKNNEDDVIKTLLEHEDSLLKPHHISSYRINWNDKVKNIKEISDELNIGLDSLVFIDDNPVEREWVKNRLPEVVVPDLPSSPTLYIDTIEHLEVFDFTDISNEDKKRTKMYKDEGRRKKEKKKFGSIEEFLSELKMKATVERVNKNNLKRVVQLINKTNQFNLTLRRHNESDIQKIFRQDAIGITVRISDKFGDSGLVGLAIAKKKRDKNIWNIDSFLLSCRVLGRKIEDLLLSLLSEKILLVEKSKEIILEGEFREGKKNQQVADFFQKRSFKILDGYDNTWVRDIKKFPIKRPKYIQVN